MSSSTTKLICLLALMTIMFMPMTRAIVKCKWECSCNFAGLNCRCQIVCGLSLRRKRSVDAQGYNIELGDYKMDRAGKQGLLKALEKATGKFHEGELPPKLA